MSNRNLVRTGIGELLSVLSTKVLSMFLGTVSSVILARTLGPAGRGQLALYVLIPGLLINLGSLGVHEATIYYLGGKRYGLDQVFSSNLFLALGLGIIYLITAIFMSRTFFWPWPAASGSLLWLALSMIPLGLLQLYLRDILRALGRIDLFNLVSLSEQRLVIVPYLALILVLGASVGVGVWANILAHLATGLLSVWLVGHVTKPVLGKVSWSYLKDSLAYGIKGHLGYSARKLGFRVDQLILAAMVGDSSLGYYVVAVNIAELLLYVSRSIAIVIFPKIVSRDQDYAREVVSTVFRLSLLVSLISGVVLALLGRPIIVLLYGPDYLPGLSALCLLIPGGFFISLSSILNRFMLGIGRPEFNTLADVAGFIVGFGAYAMLIPRYGILGAAFGSSLSYGVILVVEVYLFQRVTGNRLKSLFIVRRSDISGFLKPKMEMLLSQVIASVKFPRL